MKRLTVTYNDITIFDADVDSFKWEDGPDGVTVAGKTKGARASGGGGGLLDLLAGARKQQTAAIVEERKQELAAESGS